MEFDEYVGTRRHALLRLAYLLTGEAHHAEDLVQTALLRAFTRWRRVCRSDHPDAYVRKILVNAYLDARRRRSSSEVPTPSESLQVDLPVEAGGHGGGHHADVHADRAEMWAALVVLPRAQRAVLVLRYYEDRDDSDIAALMGCGVSTVRSNAARGLASLRKEWVHG